MIMSLLFNEPRPLPAQVETWLALAYLILFGSAILFILILVVLHRWTASATAYITVLFPFITISASALLGEDQITPALILGAALVMSGVYIGAIRPASRRIAARHTGQEA